MIKIFTILVLLCATLYANWNLYPTYPRYLQKRKALLPYYYFKANTNEKIVALTFDDGPNRFTPRIMRILKKHNAPATFFLIAKKLKYKYDYLYSNPLFSVGMHTYSHKRFNRLSKRAIENDFKKSIYLFKKHHLPHSLFRPAFGVVNSRLTSTLLKLNIKPILWSNDTKDWDKRLKSYRSVINKLSSGDIILMHDYATTPRQLERLILAIKAKGYTIVPLNYLIQYQSEYPIR